MVTDILEKLKTTIGAAEISEVSYEERGYHISVAASKETLHNVIKFFDDRKFYFEDMLCVDYKDYLEVVYFFNNYRFLCRVKVTLKVDPANPHVATMSGIFDGAAWYEREIHEFFGVVFDGHPNMGYLFLHDGIEFYPLRKGKVRIPPEDRERLAYFKVDEQEDAFTVNFGPQHPSTHGVLRVVVKMNGEYVEAAEPVLGYLHRMQEKMGENRGFMQFLPNTSRMDYLGPMSFNAAYVSAVEKLCKISVPERANIIRAITIELNRISSHLLWLGAYLADLGGLTPFLYVFDDREQINDILERITGSRLTYCYMRFGGLYNDVDEKFIEGTRAFIARMYDRLKMYDTLVTKNVIFINRTKGIGILDEEGARKYGFSGPVLRSVGVPYDIRKTEPYAAYGRINFDVPIGKSGDVLDRYMVRVHDMEVSMKIIKQSLDMLSDGPYVAEKVPKKMKPVAGDVYQAAESPRGEVGVYIVSDGTDTPYRMHWRVPSFSNLIIFPYLAPGTLIADAISILGSLDLCIPEIDR
ncbi:MAG: NADH-quinone oxidoreductase subunit D [Syntrophobacterales bacterium]|jgi:NADH-quinone oxidoreductase subunit D|nr:NADH-quinone oxidoreductase subunit D [Syntrophobacterales bacterium]